MFYIFVEDGKLNGCGECKIINEEFINYEVSEDVYLSYQEDQRRYIWNGSAVVENPNYEQDKANDRKNEFLEQFFEVPNAKGDKTGYFRRIPKGYNSAVESINTAFNAVAVLGKLPAGSMIFYEKPDFTKEEECSEDWLVANQFTNNEMTAAEFGTFYASFIEAWNNKEHL